MKALFAISICAFGMAYVNVQPARAQYQQTCRPDFLGGYRCSDNSGYDVRVRPSMGAFGGIEATDNYGNSCRRYQDFMGRIVTKCN